MKASKLMIGDWVYNPFTRKTLRLTFGRDLDLVEELCLEPIPLTKEILKKNGWIYQKYPDDEMFIWPLDNEIEMPFRLQIGMDGNRYWVTAGIGGLICPINYVHELQHALRLCGIEKEIIL